MNIWRELPLPSDTVQQQRVPADLQSLVGSDPQARYHWRPIPKLLHWVHRERWFSFTQTTHIIARVSSFSFITFRTNVTFRSLKNSTEEAPAWTAAISEVRLVLACSDFVRGGSGEGWGALYRLPDI